jgi:hypothetical protein
MTEATRNANPSGTRGGPSSDRRRQNMFFPLLAVGGGLFVVTILAMLAATAGDPQAPPSRFFRAYGTPLIVAETVLLVVLAVAALTIDRRQSLAARSAEGRDGAVTEGRRDSSPPSAGCPDQISKRSEPAA